jgi:hypothetical protein
VLILLAGFIGQFGKSLSIHIIDYFKRRQNRASESAVKETDQLPIVPAEHESQALPKADKKALKAQIKAQKKASKA